MTDAPVNGSPRAPLRLGDSGPEVAALQRALRAGGDYRGAVDGAFGPRTDLAVRVFQAHYGLDVDGVAGPEVWDTVDRCGL